MLLLSSLVLVYLTAMGGFALGVEWA